MEKKNNILLKVINIVLFVVLIIVMVLYFDARQNAKLNLESLLTAANEVHSANVKIQELEDKLDSYELDNIRGEIAVEDNSVAITITNTVVNDINNDSVFDYNISNKVISDGVQTSTEPYIPDGMKVADPNDNSGIKASDIKLDRFPENVSIEVIENTISNKSLEILITDNNKDYYGWGVEFKIQEKIDGKWTDLKYINEDVAWIAIAYVPNENNELTQKLNIESYYGILKPGTYRIVKPVYDNGYIDLYSNEFEIK